MTLTSDIGKIPTSGRAQTTVLKRRRRPAGRRDCVGEKISEKTVLSSSGTRTLTLSVVLRAATHLGHVARVSSSPRQRVGCCPSGYLLSRSLLGLLLVQAVADDVGSGDDAVCTPLPTGWSLMVNDHDENVVRNIGSKMWSQAEFAGCSDGHGHPTQSELEARNKDNTTLLLASGTEKPPNRPRSGLDWHHDNARDKGKVAIEYAPSLDTCGCYMVYEWHPGGPDSEACAGWLPYRAPIEVTDASGTTWRAFVDQSKDGGQWNPIACYDLPAGPQRVVASNAGTDECLEKSRPEHGCFWIADALMFVWQREKCESQDGYRPRCLDTRGEAVNASTALPGTSYGGSAHLTSKALEQPWELGSRQLAFAVCLGIFYHLLTSAASPSSGQAQRARAGLIRRHRQCAEPGIYLRPDAWRCVINPGGDDALRCRQAIGSGLYGGERYSGSGGAFGGCGPAGAPARSTTFTQMPSPYTTRTSGNASTPSRGGRRREHAPQHTHRCRRPRRQQDARGAGIAGRLSGSRPPSGARQQGNGTAAVELSSLPPGHRLSGAQRANFLQSGSRVAVEPPPDAAEPFAAAEFPPAAATDRVTTAMGTPQSPVDIPSPPPSAPTDPLTGMRTALEHFFSRRALRPLGEADGGASTRNVDETARTLPLAAQDEGEISA